MKTLIFVSVAAPSVQEQQVQKFMAWMGARTKSIVIDNKVEPIRQLLDESIAGCSWVITAETLSSIHKASSQSVSLRRFYEEQCASLLVFGCSDPARHSEALAWLTGGVINQVASLAENRDTENVFHMSHAGQLFSRQLAGLSFSVHRKVFRKAFKLNAAPSSMEAIMLSQDEPAFISLKIGSCQLFLLAGSETPDIEEPVSRDKGIEENYDQIIPFLIFLRSTFGQRCWHGPRSTARFIVDDPLLADRYGLLEYSALFGSMHRENYGTSIAFIPWNYRRTSRPWADTFLNKNANLSICVHGCDHTNREFEASDAALLEVKAGLALTRMEKHRERTGLPFERVMVFPQGRFSTSAILALRANQYLAAVNTTCFPSDDVPERLRMADFLRPAITQFYGFPIYQRRYPKRLIDSAFDIFLGKPALLVEHHQYLGDGCKKLEEYVRAMHRIEPELSWPTLFVTACAELHDQTPFRGFV